MNEQTKADIRKSIAILKEKGWTQGEFFNTSTGEFCLVGALRQAVFGTPYPYNFGVQTEARRERFRNAYNAVYDVTMRKPEHFNDDSQTKRRHVITVLKKAEARS